MPRDVGANSVIVSFRWPHGCRHLVMMAGSWADWRPQVMFPIKEPGNPIEIWTANIRLPTDSLHRYKFIVDGDWKYDGNQPARYNPTFGDCDNFVKLGFVWEEDSIPISLVAHTASPMTR